MVGVGITTFLSDSEFCTKTYVIFKRIIILKKLCICDKYSIKTVFFVHNYAFYNFCTLFKRNPFFKFFTLTLPK